MQPRLTREQLVDLVRRIQHAEGSEEERNDMLNTLIDNVPDPNVSDLIYYEDLTPEEVVDRALRYKPILL